MSLEFQMLCFPDCVSSIYYKKSILKIIIVVYSLLASIFDADCVQSKAMEQ